MSTPTTTITPGSRVLVTGATGYLATHIIAHFLSRGYKVRGTVRDIHRASWLTSLFKSAHETGDFELVSVPDIANTDPSSFDAAVTDVAAIANVAAITSFDPDPKKVITPTVQSLLHLLDAASRCPSVREFVHTSSFLAATAPIPGNTTRVERDTYNDDAVAFAWAEPTPDTAPMRPSMVYMTSKAEAEKALWKFVEEGKPHFSVNSVSPSTLLGQPMDKRHVVGVPTAWLRHLYEGNTAPLRRLPALYEIDVKDAALLHVAAILDPEIKNERIQAWGRHCNWNDILAIARRLYPGHQFVDDLSGMAELNISVDCSLALTMLRRWAAGQSDWRSLEETVKDGIDGVVAFLG